MLSSAPTPRRRLQVYVEIPPSPLTMHMRRNKPTTDDRPAAGSTVHVHGTSLKENAPLTASSSTSTLNSNKRKLSDCDLAMSMAAVETKKPKLAAKILDPNAKKTDKVPADFPNGFFYCHQCAKKRDVSVALQCTLKDTKGRCKVKYCKPCLKNRYGEDVDAIKITGENSDHQTGHVRGAGYFFKCPKCKDMCNCARCRKAKGLEPTGNMTTVAQRTGGGSVATLLQNNPAAIGILPGKGQQIEPKPKTKRPKAVKLLGEPASAPKLKSRPLGRPKATPKSLPPPSWTPIPNALALSFSQAESRIQIREFVLRFSVLLDIAKGNLEELECVAGMKGRTYDNDEYEEDSEEMVEWVSESCVKSVILGLLGLVVTDRQGAGEQIVKRSMKEIRGAGANLNKIWSVLASMRQSLSCLDGENLIFPDPLPPPSSSSIHTTRSTRATVKGGVCVVQSAQMVPVLEALINIVIESKCVRQEIEEGIKEAREVLKEKWERAKEENERWEAEKEERKDRGNNAQEKSNDKKAGNESGKQLDSNKKPKDNDKDIVVTEKEKALRAAHKQTLASLDYALQIAMSAYAPRFAPLGRDKEGRGYWALSPGTVERELAVEYLEEKAVRKGLKTKPKNGRRGAIDEDGRRALKRWSWFVAVWGRRPPIANVKLSVAKEDTTDDDSEEDDDGEEKWWGFWEPEEIRRLASWIGGRSGASTDEVHADSQAWSRESSPHSQPVSQDPDIFMPDVPPTEDEVKRLVKALKDNADLLEWRVKRVDANEMKGKGEGGAVVETDRFYG